MLSRAIKKYLIEKSNLYVLFGMKGLLNRTYSCTTMSNQTQVNGEKCSKFIDLRNATTAHVFVDRISTCSGLFNNI